MNESEPSTLSAPPSSTVSATTPKQRSPRMSAERALPQSTAETLVKIIKGYAIASNGGQSQINYKDVASVSGIAPTVVSGNNKFLLESQILTSPKFGYYIPSEAAVRFAREAAWDEPAAKAHLRDIIASTWYGQTALQNLILRTSLKRDELKRALAIKAGATEGDSTALEFVIDFLIYTGVIGETESGTIAKGDVELSTQATSQDVESTGVSARSDVGLVDVTTPGSSTALTLALHIHLNSPEDLTDDYAARIRQWVELVRGTAAKIDVHVQAEGDSSS
jgi:hypothetical protein